MKVFVTGATGFTGLRSVPMLLERGLEVRCLYRPTSQRGELPQTGVEWTLGDLEDADGLAKVMSGCDALLNLASLGFGHAGGIVRAARTAGIRRAVFISTTAIFTRLNLRSKEVRLAAEDTIRDSGLAYTILRPTMIYGSRRDRNIWRLITWLQRFPLIPIPGSGENLQQPVYVDDVAAAALACLCLDRTIAKCYDIAGKSAITYNELIDTIAEKLNRRVWKLHLPARPLITFLGLWERAGLRLPLKAEQIERLNEDKAFDISAAQNEFDFQPRSFREGVDLELSSA